MLNNNDSNHQKSNGIDNLNDISVLSQFKSVFYYIYNNEIWNTSVGCFYFKIDDLPPQLKLTFSLLVNIDREVDPDVQYFLLSTLKFLFLHNNVLNDACREHRGFLIFIQEKYLIPKFWCLLRSDYSQVGQLAVLLIIHSITLPCGEEVFWNTVNADFTNKNWEVRFKAVERGYVLAHLIKPELIKSNYFLQTCLSCIFSHLIISIHDLNIAIAQRTILALKALPQSSLNIMCLCLESQFDLCILDRPLIINRINLLATVVPEANILSWDFFIQRFETLVLEAQLKSNMSTGNTHFQNLLHADPMSEHYQRKVSKARQSVNEADSVRSIVKSLEKNSLNHQATNNSEIKQVTQLQKPIPQSQQLSNNSGTRYNRIREFTDEESNLCLLLNRVVDLENSERHTVYLTVSLFVFFLSSKQGVCISDEKITAKKQSLLLRHFYTLLGFSNSEKCFTIPPILLRKAAVCNAFLTGLPEILDNNLMISNQMLPIIVQLLLHLPSPQKFASDCSAADYSLSLLSLSSRQSWLHSLIIILYKYRCNTQPISDIICKLILIVVVTLETHCHLCNEKILTNLSNQPSTAEFDFQSSESLEDKIYAKDDVIKEGKINDFVTQMLRELSTSNSYSNLNNLLPSPIAFKVLKSTHSALSILENKSNEHQKFIQPEIIEPSKCKLNLKKSGFQSALCVRKRHRSKICSPPKISNIVALDSLFCGFCNKHIEIFEEETINLSLIVLSTFLHREPVMAAPILFRIIKAVTRFIDTPQYSWHETNVFVPGNSRSSAKQLIRMILHQLSNSGIALQLFDSCIRNVHSFWSTISFSLSDFNELNPVAFLQCLFDDVNENWPSHLTRILHNCAAYIITIPNDAYLSNWNVVISLLESFFRRYYAQLILESNANNNSNVSNMNLHSNSINNLNGINVGGSSSVIGGSLLINNNLQQNNKFDVSLGALNVSSMRTTGKQTLIYSELKSSIVLISAVLRVNNYATFKSSYGLVENYSKWLCETLHYCAVDLLDLLIICTACNRSLIKERDKQCITRAICCELVHAIKFKCELVEKNYMTIVELILQDFGEELSIKKMNQYNSLDLEKNIDFDLNDNEVEDVSLYNTGASEAIRPFMSDILEFIADLHVLSKIKKQTNSDKIGGDLKAALSEVVALEMSRPTVRDSRTIMRFIPWLYSPPSLAQAVPGSFVESVTYVRILSWLLLGALHSTKNTCLPIPISCSNYMADYIHFVLVGFADQSKQSVVHMSALFHVFHLCQLWTIYCEQTSTRSEDLYNKTMENILIFWARVTPAILQLLSHSKVLADMVNLHFVNTMQALQQCNSAVLCQLYPMWQPILTAYHTQIPSQLRIKLDACENQPPLRPQSLFVWLKKVRYKISQIELQTSAASPFYNV